MSSTAKDHKTVRGAYTDRQTILQKQDHRRLKSSPNSSKAWRRGKSHCTRAGRAVCPGRNFGRLLEREGVEWAVGCPVTMIGEGETGEEGEQVETEEEYNQRINSLVPDDTEEQEAEAEQEQDSFEFQLQLARALSLSMVADQEGAPYASMDNDNFNSEPEISELRLDADDADEGDGEEDAYSMMGTDLESELGGTEWVDVNVAETEVDLEEGIDRPTYAQMIKVEIG